MHLQRTIGSHAVRQLLQVGPAGDTSEGEANRVADEVLGMRGAVRQSAGDGDEAGTVVPCLVHAIVRSPGQPLDARTRAFFEPRFGQDFGHVRLHTDAAAAEAARAVNARAFTVGHDIAFGAGQHGSGPTERRLLAHELAHVVQQSGGGGASAVQRTKDEAPPAPAVYVVRQGDTPRSIAEAHHVTLENLLDANRGKLKRWTLKDGRTVEGFNSGESIVIPVAAPRSEEAAGQERTWTEWASEKAKTVADTVAGVGRAASGLWDDVASWWKGDGKSTPAASKGGHAPDHSVRLPDEQMQLWVDRAATCSREKFAVKESKQPFKVEQIDTWLVELAKDMQATRDPVQRRVLAAVQFHFESTKRGTTYKQVSPRDYDLEGTFDCSEAVQWMMRQAGLGGIFGETTEDPNTVALTSVITDIFGSRLRQQPRTGDLMLWGGHVGLVADVRPEEGVFLVSHMGGSGSYFNAFDLADPLTKDPARGLLGAGQWGDGVVRGYWRPEDASLPSPIGKAEIVDGRWTPNKYFRPDPQSHTGSQYTAGEQVNLLKQEGEMWLVQRAGSGGAAWVRAKNIRRKE